MELFSINRLALFIFCFSTYTIVPMEQPDSGKRKADEINQAEPDNISDSVNVDQRENKKQKTEELLSAQLKVITNDDKECVVEREILLLSSTIEDLIADTNTNTVTIIEFDMKTFKFIYDALKIVNEQVRRQKAGELEQIDLVMRQLDGKYIFGNLYQLIKPLADELYSSETENTKPKKIYAAVLLSHFLHLQWLTDVLILLHTNLFFNKYFWENHEKFKEKKEELNAEFEKFSKKNNFQDDKHNKFLSYPKIKKIMTQLEDKIINEMGIYSGFIVPVFLPTYRKYIKITTNMTTKDLIEFSVADYIALIGMPQIRESYSPSGILTCTLDLDYHLTSLEGLDQIKNINKITNLNLGGNYIIDVPDNIFNGFNSLESIYWPGGVIGLDIFSLFYKNLMINHTFNLLELGTVSFHKEHSKVYAKIEFDDHQWL